MYKYYEFEEYQSQLESPEWQNKRNEILKRDHNRCQICGRGKSTYVKFGNQYWNIGVKYSESANEILPSPLSISDFKKLIHANSIKIVRLPLNEGNSLIAISDNGICGNVMIDHHSDLQSIENLQINLIKHNSGLLSFVIRCRNIQSNINMGNTIYLSENPIRLNVHHKRYIIQHKAWEYAEEDLITLCNECHKKIHQTIGVEVYSDENGYKKKISITPCSKCNGTGYFPEYKHVENGVCFRCRGARFEELIKE